MKTFIEMKAQWQGAGKERHTCKKGGSLEFYGIAPVEKGEDTVAQLFLRERKRVPNQAHLA